jgi:Tol biopolymer transport system component
VPPHNPNGSMLLFDTDRHCGSNSREIYTVDSNGIDQTRVTKDGCAVWNHDASAWTAPKGGTPP